MPQTPGHRGDPGQWVTDPIRASFLAGIPLAPGLRAAEAANLRQIRLALQELKGNTAVQQQHHRGLFGREHWTGFPLPKARPAVCRAGPPMAASNPMKEFLAAVDPDSPEDDKLENLAFKLKEAGLEFPRQLEGVSEDEVGALVTSLGDKAFLRRAVRSKNLEKVPPATAASSVVLSPPKPVQSAETRLEESFGVGSADTIAQALAENSASTKTVASFLVDAHLEHLPHSLQCGSAVWAALWAETCKARQEGRGVHTYCDLTSKDFVPLWLPLSAIGGSGPMSSSPALDDSGMTRLSELGAALTRAMAKPRAFRNSAQWAAAYMRYAAVALGTSQLSLPQALTYMNVILKLSEDERIRPESTAGASIAFIYDSLFRETLCKRMRSHEVVDLDKALSEIDSEIMSAARSRVKQTSGAVSHRQAVANGEGTNNAALAASLQANSQLRTQVDKAARQLNASAKALQAKEKAAARPAYSGGGGSTPHKRGNQEDRPPRKDRRKDWWESKGNRR